MRERVVAELVTFVHDALHEIRIRLTVLADDEEGGRHLLLFQNVKNGRRPTRIGTVVKCECQQAGTIAGTLHDIRSRQRRELFRLDETTRVIELQIARALLRSEEHTSELQSR